MGARHVGERVHVNQRPGYIREIASDGIDVMMDDAPDDPHCWYRIQDVKPWPTKTRTPRPYSPAEAVAALERVAKRWPAHLLLFSASGSLHVIDTRVNDAKGITDGSIHYDSTVGTVDIPNEGGDPDWVVD